MAPTCTSQLRHCGVRLHFTCVLSAEQTVNEAVITVPPFFNQAERRAVMRAGELAGLKILQLMNANTAGQFINLNNYQIILHEIMVLSSALFLA